MTDNLRDHNVDFMFPGGDVVRANVIHLFNPGRCVVCGALFGDEHAVVLGEPYHAAIHKRCRHRFDPTREWHHPQPMWFYLHNTNPRAWSNGYRAIPDSSYMNLGEAVNSSERAT